MVGSVNGPVGNHGMPLIVDLEVEVARSSSGSLAVSNKACCVLSVVLMSAVRIFCVLPPTRGTKKRKNCKLRIFSIKIMVLE